MAKWLKTPGVTANDCNMIAMNIKIIGLLSFNEDLCWQLIERNDIVTHMEDGGLLILQCTYK